MRYAGHNFGASRQVASGLTAPGNTQRIAGEPVRPGDPGLKAPWFQRGPQGGPQPAGILETVLRARGPTMEPGRGTAMAPGLGGARPPGLSMDPGSRGLGRPGDRPMVLPRPPALVNHTPSVRPFQNPMNGGFGIGDFEQRQIDQSRGGTIPGGGFMGGIRSPLGSLAQTGGGPTNGLAAMLAQMFGGARPFGGGGNPNAPIMDSWIRRR